MLTLSWSLVWQDWERCSYRRVGRPLMVIDLVGIGETIVVRGGDDEIVGVETNEFENAVQEVAWGRNGRR